VVRNNIQATTGKPTRAKLRAQTQLASTVPETVHGQSWTPGTTERTWLLAHEAAIELDLIPGRY